MEIIDPYKPLGAMKLVNPPPRSIRTVFESAYGAWRSAAGACATLHDKVRNEFEVHDAALDEKFPHLAERRRSIAYQKACSAVLKDYREACAMGGADAKPAEIIGPDGQRIGLTYAVEAAAP